MKSNLDKMYKTDKELEMQGVWFEQAPGVKFLCKRMGGKNQAALKAAHLKYYKPHARQIQKGILSEEKEKQIMTRVFIDTCLLDWSGVEINGELKDYDKETAYELLVTLPELVSDLTECAGMAESYLEEREDLGNS